MFKIVFFLIMKNFLMYSGFDIESKNMVNIYYCFNEVLVEYENSKIENYDSLSVLKSENFTYIYLYYINYYETTYYYVSKKRITFKKLYLHNYFKIYDKNKIVNKNFVF